MKKWVVGGEDKEKITFKGNEAMVEGKVVVASPSRWFKRN